MTEPNAETRITRVLDRSEAAVQTLRRFFAGYFWLILKNVLGVLLILLAFPVGLTVPGPGGLPLFLIGFALVAFPGKRKITSHVLRGRPLRIEAYLFTILTTFVSLVVIGLLLWCVGNYYKRLILYFNLDPDHSTPGFVAAVAGVCVIAAVVTWGVMWLALRFVNKFIRIVPRIRRFIRPFLRKWGIVLLPPPRRLRGSQVQAPRENAEIVELSLSTRERFKRWWKNSKPWLRRMTGLAITAALLFYIIRPVVRDWSAIEPFLNRVRPISFLAAVIIFASFLFVFRVTSWWMILRGLGHVVPLAPATRIWSTSELARYLPGVIWQVMGRIYLLRPYGVPGSVCSTSQVLELIVFLLANIIVAVGCLLWFGFKHVHGDARWWLVGLMGLLPLLTLLLHPKIFYALMNRIIRQFKRPALEARVPGVTLMLLLLWNILGVTIMSLAIWMIVSGPLELPITKWWVVAGAYCLAWCAGFLAIWAPGGLGVREVVFMTIVVIILPDSIKSGMNAEGLKGFAHLLALVLRVWATAGELIVAIAAYSLDIRGALLSFSTRSGRFSRTTAV